MNCTELGTLDISNNSISGIFTDWRKSSKLIKPIKIQTKSKPVNPTVSSIKNYNNKTLTKDLNLLTESIRNVTQKIKNITEVIKIKEVPKNDLHYRGNYYMSHNQIIRLLNFIKLFHRNRFTTHQTAGVQN